MQDLHGQKEKKRDFFAQLEIWDQNKPIDLARVNRVIQEKVDKLGHSTVGEILRNLANIQKGYDAVVSSLSTAFVRSAFG